MTWACARVIYVVFCGAVVVRYIRLCSLISSQEMVLFRQNKRTARPRYHEERYRDVQAPRRAGHASARQRYYEARQSTLRCPISSFSIQGHCPHDEGRRTVSLPVSVAGMNITAGKPSSTENESRRGISRHHKSGFLNGGWYDCVIVVCARNMRVMSSTNKLTLKACRV